MSDQCLNWLVKLHIYTMASAEVPHFTHAKNTNPYSGL